MKRLATHRLETHRLETHRLETHGWELGLLAFSLLMFAYLLDRNLGLMPAVFADEWYYSKFSRLGPLQDSIIPSWLYLWLFSASNACGDGFLDCVRVLNAVFFVASTPFIYLTARLVAGKPVAAGVTLLCLLAPANSYTAYFMPESMYFFGFWVLTWLALTRTALPGGRYALATGAVLGLMSLVKVHALFLLPSLCLFALYVSSGKRAGEGRQRRRIARGLLAALLVAVAAFAVKFGLGYVLAGPAALNLFGSFYASLAGSAAGNTAHALLPAVLVNGRGHLMALALLFGLPLAVLAHALLSGPARAQTAPGARALHLYCLLMLGAAVGVTVIYTASLGQHGAGEVLRLHLRYYNFAFPLLFMIGAAALDAPPRKRWSAPAWAVALLLLLVLLAALLKLPGYAMSPADGAEIASVDTTRAAGRALLALQAAIVLLWALGSKGAARLFVFVFLPVLVLLTSAGVNRSLARLIPAWEHDQAGQFAHRYVKPAERRHIAVASETLAYLMRVQFHIDDKGVTLIDLPKGAPVAPYLVPAGAKWLLVVGDHALPAGMTPEVKTSGFSLVALDTNHRRVGAARLSEPPGGLLASIEGMAAAEPWGRWSTGKQVVLRFASALPKNLNVVLKAKAFGPNAGLEFTARAGGSEARFRLREQLGEVLLRLDTDGTGHTLRIDVPQPVSPKTLGLAPDVRALGIGITEVEIGERVR